jgi:hypothetical protein
MDKKFKAFIVALIAVPFAFAFVRVLERLGVLPFLDGWNDYVLVIELFVGGSYMLALKMFSNLEKDLIPHDVNEEESAESEKISKE